MQKMGGVILAAVMVLASLIAVPAIASAGTTCVDGVAQNTHANGAIAKAKYVDDCGTEFLETSSFSCGWVSGGFRCKGPDTGYTGAASSPAANSGTVSSLEAPGGVRHNGNGLLEWNPVGGAASYNVYRNAKYWTSTSELEIREYYLEAQYYVVAVDASKTVFSPRSNVVNASNLSDSAVESNDQTAAGNLYAPQVRSIVYQSDIWVGWGEVLGATKYNVYRGSTYITTTEELAFWDRSMHPGQYKYYVVAVNGSGTKFSPKSATTTATVDRLMIEAPRQVAAIRTADNAVKVMWTEDDSSAPVIYWELFRDGALLTTLKNTGFLVDTTAVSGKAHTYQVRAVAADKTSPVHYGPLSGKVVAKQTVTPGTVVVADDGSRPNAYSFTGKAEQLVAKYESAEYAVIGLLFGTIRGVAAEIAEGMLLGAERDVEPIYNNLTFQGNEILSRNGSLFILQDTYHVTGDSVYDTRRMPNYALLEIAHEVAALQANASSLVTERQVTAIIERVVVKWEGEGLKVSRWPSVNNTSYNGGDSDTNSLTRYSDPTTYCGSCGGQDGSYTQVGNSGISGAAG